MSRLDAYWQSALATDELGEYMELVTTSQAVGDNAASTLICSDLIDNDPGFDEDHYGGWYVYVPGSPPQQKRVRQSGGFTPSSGALLLNAPLSGTATVGTTFWLIRRMGVLKHQGQSGLRDAVNAALADWGIEEHLEIGSGTSYPLDTDDGTYDLSALVWMTQQLILGLRKTYVAGEPRRLAPGMPHLRKDRHYLILEPQIEVAEGDTLTLDLVRSGTGWIKTGSTWANSSVGLVNDSDEAVPDVELLTPAVVYHAFLGLAKGTGQDTTYWELKASGQLATAEDIKSKNQPMRERSDDMLLEDAEGAIDESAYSWPD